MKVLVLNAGSSSLKFQLIATDEAAIANNAEHMWTEAQALRVSFDLRRRDRTRGYIAVAKSIVRPPGDRKNDERRNRPEAWTEHV